MASHLVGNHVFCAWRTSSKTTQLFSNLIVFYNKMQNSCGNNNYHKLKYINLWLKVSDREFVQVWRFSVHEALVLVHTFLSVLSQMEHQNLEEMTLLSSANIFYVYLILFAFVYSFLRNHFINATYITSCCFRFWFDDGQYQLVESPALSVTSQNCVHSLCVLSIVLRAVLGFFVHYLSTLSLGRTETCASARFRRHL